MAVTDSLTHLVPRWPIGPQPRPKTPTLNVALFSTVLSWFKNSDTILYLNKSDLLSEKIKNSQLKDHFPNYNGPQSDADKAKNFLGENTSKYIWSILFDCLDTFTNYQVKQNYGQ